MKKIIILLSLVFVLFGFNSTVFALSDDITQINFTSDPQTININTASTQLTTQTQNNKEDPEDLKEPVSETTTLNYTSTSGTGQFSDANCSLFSNAPITLIMNSGSANKNFCYKDSTPGIYTLTVSAEGKDWTSAAQNITIVNPVTLSSITITIPATKLEYIVGDSLDISGLVVTGTYSDDSTQVETIIPEDIAGFDSSAPTVGQVLTITVDGVTTNYTIDIDAIPTENIILKIYSGDTILFDGPKTVTACAESPEVDAPITVNGKCAIEQSGLSNTWIWYDSNFSTSSELPKTLGVLDELGGSSSDNVNYVYWGWFSNLNYGSTALNKHTLIKDEELLLTYNSYPLRISASKVSGIVGDTITFTAEEKSTFDENWNMVWTSSLGVTITLGTQSCITIDGTCSIVLDTVGSLNAIGSKSLYVPSASIGIEISSSGGGSSTGGSAIVTLKVFSVPQALSFLSGNQNEDGSFSSDMYTDWVAISVAEAGDEGQTIKTKIYDYLISQDINSTIITDYERRAMALMALNINPYNGTSINYIDKIIDSFDGNQIGDSSIYNDDIFGLIVLAKAGYLSNENIILKTIDFIISKQGDDGFWDNVDITSAVIQAFKNFEEVNGVSNAIEKGLNYLISVQNNDGGFGNSFSTSWASQALTFNSQASETLEYLANQQQDDGGVDDISNSNDNRVWATSYAIPAVLSLSWNDILNSFSKPTVASSGGGSYSPSTPEEKPPSAPLPEELPPAPTEETISDLMAVIETIPQEQLLEIIPKVKKPIKKIILEKENIIEVTKIDEVDDETKNLLQASAGNAKKGEFYPTWKIIALISGILFIVIGGFVVKFKI